MPIVFRKKCPKCGKYSPSASLAKKCPYCGHQLIKIPIIKKGDVTPYVILTERELEKRKRQADLVKDYGFPDVNEEIAKSKKGDKR